jgi:hypothetical protein
MIALCFRVVVYLFWQCKKTVVPSSLDQAVTLKMKALYAFETLVSIYEEIEHMNPEDLNLCYSYYYQRNNVYKNGYSYNIVIIIP